ncbi:c-type cytochrome biogenesis protein CcmI [uncultured Limimaricola sp.]|uniref:c-type cytochrome biogenesis protein CcmI n=1 Tax=uncultured Limimaricola sp. TaxID=2211667 RepID=UPI0030F5E1F7
MLFWIIAAGLSGVVAVALAVPLRQHRALGGTAPDVTFYRGQLAEIDTDRARGLISDEEAERARAEIARRLIAADRTQQAETSQQQSSRGPVLPAAIIGAVLVIGGALALYADLGAPGVRDQPLGDRIEAAQALRAARPSQSAAEAVAPATPANAPQDYLDMVAQLRAAVPERPDDLTGWQLLSRHEAALGNYAAAARAQERVIAIKGETATFEDRLALVDRMVAATGGLVTPEAEAHLVQLLSERLDAAGPLYYMGLMQAQTERPDLAFRYWKRAIEQGDPASPHVELARAQIGRAAALAGVDYTLPTLPGPSAADVAAAQDMSVEDRDGMIRGMVEGLSDRLAESGGSASEWARLIRALGVLGERDRAAQIWTEAQEVFAGTGELDQIRAAARDAGVAQ